MALTDATKSSIQNGIKNLYVENKKKTDCDWIFDGCKEEIIKAVKDGHALSKLVKVIKQAGTYSHTDLETNVRKELKVTTAKLAKWLKENGIKRKVHKRKKTEVNKKTENNKKTEGTK